MYIYMYVADSLHCTAETSNIVRQLYPNLGKKKMRQSPSAGNFKIKSKLVHSSTFSERHEVARKGVRSLDGIKECFLEGVTHSKISRAGKDFREQCMESHGARATDGIYQGPVLCRAGTTLPASPYPVHNPEQ